MDTNHLLNIVILLFTVFISVVATVRIAFIIAGSDNLREKIGKIGNWIVGVALLTISWAVVDNVIFKQTNLKTSFSKGNKISSDTQSKKERKPDDDKAVKIIIVNDDEKN